MNIKLLKEAYIKHLIGPIDDYWANGIIANKKHQLINDGEFEGYVVIDKQVIYEYYMHETPIDIQDKILNELIDHYSIKEIIAPTYDTVLYNLLLNKYNSTIVSLCYAGYKDKRCIGLRAELVNQNTMSILLDYTDQVLGGNRGENEDYYTMLLKMNGIYLFYKDDLLIGTGELRHFASHAYLGMTVDKRYRNNGYGTCILNQMKYMAYDRNLIPLCGVDTDNISSVKAIEKAGFKQTFQIHKFEVISE